MKICLIRHGETDWNVIGRLQGREDIPLNANGLLQAEQCGLALKNQKWDAVITSPLKRAKQTADIIAGVLDIAEVVVDEDLVERDYGKAGGLLPEERKVLFPDGKYEGYEPCELLRERMKRAVKRGTGRFTPGNVIMVSHGGAINRLLADVSDGEIGKGKTRLKNACINMFTVQDERLELVYYNKTADELTEGENG